MKKRTAHALLGPAGIGSVLIMCASLVLSQQATTIKKSFISVYRLSDQSTQVTYTADKLIEAPNWSPDGKQLLVNTGGDLYTLPVIGGAAAQLKKIDLGAVSHCNNDKGFSPDGKTVAFSARAGASGSQVYTVAAEGGSPKLIVPRPQAIFMGFHQTDVGWRLCLNATGTSISSGCLPVGARRSV